MLCNIFLFFLWRKRLLAQKNVVPLQAECVEMVVQMLICAVCFGAIGVYVYARIRVFKKVF